MRFLFTCVPGLGHFHPMLPLARAAIAAGHDVAFATAPGFAAVIEQAGIEHLAAGLDWDERRLLETVPDLRAIEPIYRGEWMMRHLFLDRAPRHMVPDLLRLAPKWGADLIVAGSFEYGGPLAAEKLGLPYASAIYMPRWNRWILKHAVGRSIARLRKAFGLPADPEMRAFGRYLDLCFSPPSWSFETALLQPALTRLVGRKVVDPSLPLRQRLWGLRALALQRIFARTMRRHPNYRLPDATTHFIGEGEGALLDKGPLPDWLRAMPRQPTIFVSLGTVLSADYPGIFSTIIAALRDKPVNVVITLGGKGDPASFGAQPANVRIVPFMTQGELQALLPHVDICINHAGYGSVMEALLRGIPLILLPLVSDAPMNAQMCRCSGVSPHLAPAVWGLSPKGLPVLRAERLSGDVIAEAVARILSEPGYRENARRLQHELAERETLEQAVALLEGAATGARMSA